MSDGQPAEAAPTGYWAAFGYHNQVLPIQVVPRDDGRLTALCGALTWPDQVSEKDDRPECPWCPEQVRAGLVRIVPLPGIS